MSGRRCQRQRGVAQDGAGRAGHRIATICLRAIELGVGLGNQRVQAVDARAKLRAAAKRVAADPAVVQTINRAGSPIEYLDAPEFQSYWNADAALMTEAVKKIGKVE